MSTLLISSGQISTDPAVAFSGKMTFTSSGINADSGSFALNTRSPLSITKSGGVVTQNGLSLAPSISAPSTDPEGYSISGAVDGIKPPAPTIVGLSLGANSGEVVVDFDLSPINCGDDITSVTIGAFIGGVYQTQQTTTNVMDPYTFTGLSAGQTYTFEMYASTQSYSEGEISEMSSPIVVGTIPDAPTMQYGVINSNGTWFVQWGIPYNGGLALNYSQTQVDVKFGGVSVAGAPFTDNALVAGGSGYDGAGYTTSLYTITTAGSYSFYVRVKNALGYGPWSSAYTLTYSPPAPAVFSGMSAFNPWGDSSGRWALQWGLSSGAPIVYNETQIRIVYGGTTSYYYNTPGGPWGGAYYSGFGYTDSTGLPQGGPGQTWYFSVRVKNAGGYSDWSPTRSVSW
jgi:hypothetical protein